MAQKYGALYDAWESAVLGNDGSNPESWRNMRALYETFKARFYESSELIQQANKRRKLNEDNGVMVEEEIKMEEPLQIIPSFSREAGQAYIIDEGIPCANCRKTFIDFTVIVYLENCNHMVCKECLTESINLQYPDSCCPMNDCDKKLYEAEIR